MKVKIMLGLLFVLGTTFGATALSGSDPEPLCRPGIPCIEKGLFDGDPQPMCRPGIPCQVELKKFDGDPTPPCLPDRPCIPR